MLSTSTSLSRHVLRLRCASPALVRFFTAATVKITTVQEFTKKRNIFPSQVTKELTADLNRFVKKASIRETLMAARRLQHSEDAATKELLAETWATVRRRIDESLRGMSAKNLRLCLATVNSSPWPDKPEMARRVRDLALSRMPIETTSSATASGMLNSINKCIPKETRNSHDNDVMSKLRRKVEECKNLPRLRHCLLGFNSLVESGGASTEYATILARSLVGKEFEALNLTATGAMIARKGLIAHCDTNDPNLAPVVGRMSTLIAEGVEKSKEYQWREGQKNKFTQYLEDAQTVLKEIEKKGSPELASAASSAVKRQLEISKKVVDG